MECVSVNKKSAYVEMVEFGPLLQPATRWRLGPSRHDLVPGTAPATLCMQAVNATMTKKLIHEKQSLLAMDKYRWTILAQNSFRL